MVGARPSRWSAASSARICYVAGRLTKVLVHLVRHGQVDNPGDLFYGRLPGFPLSDKGREQAEVTARYLAAFGGSIRELRCSPLDRARETAGILQRVLGLSEPAIDERLTEAGSWREGLPRSPAPLAYVRRYFNSAERAKSEAEAAVAERVVAAVRDARSRLKTDDDAAVLVAHQTPIWLGRVALEHGQGAFRRRSLKSVSPWFFVRSPCDVASVSTLVFEGASERPSAVRYFAP